MYIYIYICIYLYLFIYIYIDRYTGINLGLYRDSNSYVDLPRRLGRPKPVSWWQREHFTCQAALLGASRGAWEFSSSREIPSG